MQMRLNNDSMNECDAPGGPDPEQVSVRLSVWLSACFAVYVSIVIGFEWQEIFNSTMGFIFAC